MLGSTGAHRFSVANLQAAVADRTLPQASSSCRQSSSREHLPALREAAVDADARTLFLRSDISALNMRLFWSVFPSVPGVINAWVSGDITESFLSHSLVILPCLQRRVG